MVAIQRYRSTLPNIQRGNVVRQIGARELAAKLSAKQPVYLLDVRQPWEHETAALPNSLLVPLNELAGRMDELHPPDDALVVVYCHHGIRSLSGAAILENAGFKNVASLAGGIDAWSILVDPRAPRY
jgi:rhodanese-related sulfurtransferase